MCDYVELLNIWKRRTKTHNCEPNSLRLEKFKWTNKIHHTHTHTHTYKHTHTHTLEFLTCGQIKIMVNT